ncbi:MAG: hypothetical protein ABI877_03245, partial [Gemmatimonadaceae bacterium]
MTLDLRAIRRQLRSALPAVQLTSDDSLSLERSDLPVEPPHTRACEMLEGATLDAVPLEGEPLVGFAAFLDGIQTSRVWHYDDGIPVIFGHAAATVRARVGRRLTLWGDLRESGRFYVPLELLSPGTRAALESLGVSIENTLPKDDRGGQMPHPLQLLRHAIHAVQRDRENVERECAEVWCERQQAPLFVDGGLPRGERSSISPWCVGVVKSHHTLYAKGDALRVIAALGEGERTRVFQIDPTWGPAVASWYLRVRRRSGQDPLWGLVRVEIALDAQPMDVPPLTERANLVSRWILAERTPLALPDGRWDRMAYGVRDCESFLRA